MSILNLQEAVLKAVENENWYAALALALTLPDICGKLEGDTSGSEQRYVNWFTKYLSKHNTTVIMGETTTFLTGLDCYALRCAFLHEGNNDITTQRARAVLKKFIFVATESHRLIFDNEVLVLNVSEFCSEICEGVDDWYLDIKSNPDIKNRIDKMMEIQLGGFSPIPGVDVTP